MISYQEICIYPEDIDSNTIRHIPSAHRQSCLLSSAKIFSIIIPLSLCDIYSSIIEVKEAKQGENVSISVTS